LAAIPTKYRSSWYDGHMYKALITDIDGTVIAIGTNGSDITDQTRHAVKEALQKGKKITIATGRTWPSAGPVVKSLGLTDPCIIEGGSCIIDPQTEKIMWNMLLDEAASQKVLDISKKFVGGRVAIKSTSDAERLPIAHVDTMTGPNRVIYLLGLDAATAETVTKAINATDFAVAHKTTPSWFGPELTDVHVTHPDGTKEHAIAEWQKMMDVAKEETIGLGDSENDLPLFRSAGLKVAVGNAHENLKAKADEVVAAFDQGGLEQTITQFLL
jgi:HAD superfamily hydrolase (TIGR01484 family)